MAHLTVDGVVVVSERLLRYHVEVCCVARSRDLASYDLLIGRCCGDTHRLPVATGTRVLWVSCRDAPVCRHIQGEVTAGRQPAAVLLCLLCLGRRVVLVLWHATCGVGCNVGGG